jgi:hypothetical protein
MRAAILCPGPSLARALPLLADGRAGEYALTLAINRAAAAWPADFWVMLDAATFGQCEPQGEPRIVTDAAEWVRVLETHPEAARFRVLFEDGIDPAPPSINWFNYSSIAAAVLAKSEGATEIVLFGNDLAGIADWDGVTDVGQPRNRCDARWAKERAIWQDVGEWMASEDVTLTKWKE